MSETNWAGKNVPQMWSSAQAADTQIAWQQVNAWRRTHDLLLHHASRLKACADDLSYAWPPDRSPAAQAFIAYITQLREAILQASTDAATNYSAIAGVLTSLSSAKADMGKLMQAWDNYESAPTAEMAHSGASAQESLNIKARARMAQNDQEVMEASRRFVQLTPPRERTIWEREPFDAGSNGGSDTGSASSAGAVALSAPRMTPPVISPVEPGNDGVDLSGTSVVSPPGNLSDSPSTGASAGIAPSGQSIQNLGPGLIGKVPIAHGGSIENSSRVAGPASLRAGPPGAVGGTIPVSSVPVGASRNPGRVNPVGGVIEPNRPTSSTSTLPFMGGARGSTQSHRDSTAALTMQWDVPEGVSPVIEPTPELPFELGPGVIGIDR